jgi:hypothetical protein
MKTGGGDLGRAGEQQSNQSCWLDACQRSLSNIPDKGSTDPFGLKIEAAEETVRWRPQVSSWW